MADPPCDTATVPATLSPATTPDRLDAPTTASVPYTDDASATDQDSALGAIVSVPDVFPPDAST
jgi:hypothetical protein